MSNLPDTSLPVNHLESGNRAITSQKLPDGNLSIREFFRAKATECAEAEAGFEAQVQAERRTASRSHTALAVLTAELGFSDKSYRLLSVLCGISDGHHSFKTTFGELYSQLRKHDPKLKDENGQLASKASQTVRRYVDALVKDQTRTGVALAEIQTGTIGKDGTHHPTCVSLPLLDYLDEVNRRTKASPSYSRNSVQIRKVEARKLAAELLLKAGFACEQERTVNPVKVISRRIKQSAGMLESLVSFAKQHGYTDEAIRQWLFQELDASVKAVLLAGTDTADIEGWEHGAAAEAADLDSILTPHDVPETVSELDTNFDTLPDLQAAENPQFSEQASVDYLHSEAVQMVEVFEGVGAASFDLTITNEQGVKTEFERGVPADHLKSLLPDLLWRCEQAKLNVIIRPQLVTGATNRLVQLDDLDPDSIERVRPYCFLAIETSPGNFQAWLSIEHASDELVRRLKKGVGADSTASGATRIAASRNFKPKHAPAYPQVRVALVSPGRMVTASELDQAALLAPKESTQMRARHAPMLRNCEPRMWPSYQRCLADSPKAHNHDGPDRSHADFEFCLIAIDRGWPVEATAQRLMLESAKAEREGYKYAMHTARNAAGVVASRRGF